MWGGQLAVEALGVWRVLAALRRRLVAVEWAGANASGADGRFSLDISHPSDGAPVCDRL